VLAGGQGLRMQGQDKGLMSFQGQPLFQRAVDRLLPQVAKVCVNANRNLTQYQTSGCEVFSDGTTTSQGPLAGFLTGLRICPTEWLMTVACDTPFFFLAIWCLNWQRVPSFIRLAWSWRNRKTPWPATLRLGVFNLCFV